MKRILSLILAVVMLFGVMLISSSCDVINKVRINRALEKTNELEYVDLDVDMSITVNRNTQKIGYSMEIDASDEDDPIAFIEMDDYKLYMDSDYVYVDDEEIKFAIDNFDGSTLSGDDINTFFEELPDEVFDDAEYKKGKKGKLTMTAEIEDELFEDIFGDITKGISEGLGSSNASLSYDDCELTLVIKDGYVIAYGLEFDLEVKMDGTSVDVAVSFTITVNDPGDDGEVTLPKGCKSWDEVK